MKVAISVGDLNGIGIEILLKTHNKIKNFITPVYCINKTMLKKAANLLKIDIPKDFEIIPIEGDFEISPGKISKESGKFSFDSFFKAVELAKKKEVDAIVTMPINKKAWEIAGIKYKGHTSALRDIFKQKAIMMLGSKEMFIGLFTEHIPLREVFKHIKREKLLEFFIDFYNSTNFQSINVLGLNPHAGDDGVLGNEEKEIKFAIKKANEILKKEIFKGPLVPDVAFIEKKGNFIAMYHDQGLIPLKTLYFDEAINITLNLPITRVSVDHGTAFDIAYKNKAKTTSYENAVKFITNLIK